MAHRILVLKPPYGCALITQLDGSIQLHYNTTHTSDEQVFEWIKATFDAHTEHVEQNNQAELRAATPVKPITVAAIVAPVIKASPAPVKPVTAPVIPREYSPPMPVPINPPGQDHTFIGGKYRIGRQCVVCHQVMTGNEGKCPGEIVIAAPEEKK